MRQISIVILFVILLLVACSKDKETKPEETPAYSPRISFVSVTPQSVKEFADSLVFQIAYRDSDGDLGENDLTKENLFLVDERIQITYGYRIPQLSPSNSNITIDGVIDIVLPNTAITDGSSSQKATYSIYVTDRAGNKSNTVTSSEITISQ